MKRTHFSLTLGLALLITSLAFAAYAGPIITVTPDEAGPIACEDSQTFIVHYNPNDYTGELGGFSIQLANGPGDYAIFDDSNNSPDIVNLGWTGGFFGSDGTGIYEISVDGTLIGGTPIPAETEADLFSITLHGDATGIGELNILGITLVNNDGADPIADTAPGLAATLEVDCTAPDAPVMDTEPTYTAGTENTVSWSAVTGAAQYNIRCSNGESFLTTDTFYTFGGLVHNTDYCFDVQAIDGVGNIGVFSGQVCSTQDSVAPESAAGPLAPAYGTWNIDIPFTASDDMSGVQYVQLYFQVDGGGFMPYGTTFTASPIAFVATVDGDYEFYTLATDNAGNAEVDPEADSVSTTLDTTAPEAPVMCAEDPYTPGTTNEVCWSAVADAVLYRVHCDNGDNSGWIAELVWTFTDLVDGNTYSYWVEARDALENVGVISAPVSSTQDDLAPVSSIDTPPSGNMNMLDFDIAFTADDATSGVDLTRLYYQLDGGAYVEFGDGFPTSPIAFTAPSDGVFNFYTIAVDVVGNVELAPLDPDLVLNIDTGGPIGTFVINNDEEYTTSPDVTLNYAMMDASGVFEIQFSLDGGATWSTPVLYADFPTAFDITLTGGEGENIVWGRFWDNTGLYSDYSDAIILDTIAPLPVSVPWSTGAIRGHEMVTLSWTEDDADGDLAKVEIWAALWDGLHDEWGTSVYPTFRGNTPSTSPVPPTVESLGGDPDYMLIAEVDAGVLTYVHSEDSPWARSGFSYYFFAKDNAGNYSGPQTDYPRRAVNYILGDFNEDGLVEIFPDVTEFAVVYGAELGVDDVYAPVYDIAPANSGIPLNDDQINFEDLMVLSTSFNAQDAGKAADGESETPALTWFPEDELTWVLGLVDPCNSVKGLRLSSMLPENVTMEYGLGRELEGNSGYFLANNDRRGLDLGFAVLGSNMVLAGTGEILRVTTSEPVDLSKIAMVVRDSHNEDVEFELTAEPLIVLPTAYMLGNNYPNPFNPETTIKFALPDPQDVKLEIFDIKGYRVQVLLNESMEAGNHSVMWNGRDKNGRMVASGTYFYRIQAGPLNQTHRMLLIK